MKNIFLAVIALSLISSGCSSGKKVTDSSMHFAKNIIVAHRGAWKTGSLPENSIASLDQAVKIGCAGSEFDVHLTADDSLVINHDAVFGGKHIQKSSYASLLETRLSNSEPIPTLYQYLSHGIQQHTTMLVLEIKPSEISKERGQYTAQKVVELVQQLHAQSWIIYISFDYAIIKKVLELQPDAKVQYLNGDKSPLELKNDGVTGLDYHYSVFKKYPEWVKQAKDNNIVLNAWTVNTAEDMKWLIENKFDYITTNEPELLFELIK
jgi:glycerophosphoryl diester phosphodiesterase